MELGQEVLGTPEGTPINQEVLEEMIWFFRVEDAAPWNYSILGLTVVVVVISMVLLGKSIQANRNGKRQSQEKETPEAQYLRDAGDKESNSLNNLREMLTSGKPDLALVGIELNEKDDPQVYLPEPQETES